MIGIDLIIIRKGADAEHAVFRLEDDLDVRRHEIRDESRDADSEIDVEAVLEFERRTRCHVFTGPGHQAVSSSRVRVVRSEEHTSELQSLMRISYAVFCLKKKMHNYNT